MRILRAADHRVMPWKNGGGSTTEVAISPAGAGLDTFDWRVSMAGVSEDGPFSCFPGIDRTLALLDGAGLVLEVEGRPSVTLAHQGEAASFPGDAATGARLVGGPILDLNIMTRRGRFTHLLTYHSPGSLTELAAQGDVTLLLARGAMRVGEDLFAANDAVVLERGDAPLALSGEAACFVVTLRREASPLDN